MTETTHPGVAPKVATMYRFLGRVLPGPMDVYQPYVEDQRARPPISTHYSRRGFDTWRERYSSTYDPPMVGMDGNERLVVILSSPKSLLTLYLPFGIVVSVPHIQLGPRVHKTKI